MKSCTNCEQPLTEAGGFCPACGAPTATATRRRFHPRRWLAAGFALVGLVIAGLLALRFVSTTSSEYVGGADSPESAVESFAAALAAEDVFAALTFIAPDEIDGASDVLESLLSTIDAGSGGLADGTGFSVELELTDVDARLEGDHAAIVSFEASGSIAAGDDSSPAGVALPTSTSFDVDDLESVFPGGGAEVSLVTVELGGNWYVSPMLSLGHLVVENADLPGGDFDLVGDKRRGGFDDPEEAVDAMVEAIEDRDVDDLAESLGGGEGRFVAVFSDALDELVDDIPDDVGYSIDVRTRPGDGDSVVLQDVAIEWFDAFSAGSVEVEDDCISVEDADGDGDRVCVLDELPLNDSVDEMIELMTVEEDGGRRVRLVPTLTDLAARLAPAVDRQAFLYAAWLEWADTATPMTVGSDVEIEYDGDLYRVFSVDVDAGQRYRVSADGAFDVVVREPDGRWTRVGSSLTPESDTSVRVVTYSEDEDDDWYGFPDGDGGDTLRVLQVPTQTGPFPAVLTGDLGPGEEILFELDVTTAENVLLDFVADESIRWRFVGGDYELLGDDSYGLESGTVSIAVWNSGSGRGAFELTPEAVTTGFGGAPWVVVDISGGSASSSVSLPEGRSTITAVPLDGQDIVLEIPALDCYSDDVFQGDAEECTVTVNGPSTVTVEVRGWSSSDRYGQVELVLS